jgi:hypothetical protein
MKPTHWIAHIEPWLLFVGYSYKGGNQNPNIPIQIMDKIVVLYVVLWLEPYTLLSLVPSCASSSTYVLGIKRLDLRRYQIGNLAIKKRGVPSCNWTKLRMGKVKLETRNSWRKHESGEIVQRREKTEFIFQW